MKQLLLILIIGLPSLALAQPSLTFNPANGAVNVSTTDDLIITSDKALNLTNGDDLTDGNAASFVDLRDESNNPVPFTANESMGRRRITINPTGALLENHTYTLTVVAVEDDDGTEIPSQQITFTTGDFTAPVINLARGVDNEGESFRFLINVNEDATIYYVVDTDDDTPSRSQIRNGRNENNQVADASGSFSVTANTDTYEEIDGLEYDPDKYYIHFFAEDTSPSENESDVLSRGLPILSSSSVGTFTPNGFTLTVNYDENVTVYYVVTQSSTVPTSAQIIAGEDDAGGSPVTSGSFTANFNTNTNRPITGLDDLTTYWVHFVATDGTGQADDYDNESVIGTHSATTTDGSPPMFQTLTPADNSTAVDISTNTLTIVFDENIVISSTGTSGPGSGNDIRLFEEGDEKERIERGDPEISISGNTATITFSYDLLANKNYHIQIGDRVFADAAGNDFAGLSGGDWNFTTSGILVNNLTSSICSGSFQSIGNIVISEKGAGDLNNNPGTRSLVLSLTNASEFVIANSGVSVSGLSADITSLSVTVGLTSLTLEYTTNGTSVLDQITISGLKIYATGAVTNATIVRTGGNADIDGGNLSDPALTYATIQVGSSPPAQPALAASQDLIHCEGEDLTGKTLTLVDQGPGVTYQWYRDAGLTDLAHSTSDETIDIVPHLFPSATAALGDYSFYLVAVSECQSAPPVEIVIEVGKNPVADAGPDRIGPGAVCPDTELTLGGNPTLVEPSAPGPYTYDWNYVEGTTEPASLANPTYTVDNVSTTGTATYTFEVTITDVNGCFGTDQVVIEVKPTFNISLSSPNSYTFTPNSPPQNLEAVPSGGVFSGVGVIQSTGSPPAYQFVPTLAHESDPNTLPKSFDIYYTVTQDGCTQTNHHIATFTLSNSFFSTLQPEYCANEYPNPNVNGVVLSLDANGHTQVESRAVTWNSSQRFTRIPVWTAGVNYEGGSFARVGTDIYRCAAANCVNILLPPSADPNWVHDPDALEVEFNGYIANYYEGAYGGNASIPTIVKLSSTYTVNGKTFNHFRFGTNINYLGCPTCNYAWPAAYVEFVEPEDVKFLLYPWNSTSYYYYGSIVRHGGQVYKCIASPNTTGTDPASNPSLWTLVTNSDYSTGEFFHHWDASLGRFRSGFYVNGQYVQINRNPTVFFSGLAAGQDVCEFDVLNLDDPSSSSGILYTLTGNYANQGLVQSFSVRLDGSGTFDDGNGTIENDIHNPGRATFNTFEAFSNSPGGAPQLKNIEIRYQVDPGTDGSTGQPCFGTSSLVVQVVQNSTFDFDDSIVDADGSVYCYTEGAKNLRSLFNGTPINGTAGAPNSVVYSGFGVNDLGNSLGTFRPAVALEQVSPGTTVQQSIPVTAIYRDANQCRSQRIRTFKVNPDIEPSFAFGGRVNYCYEDSPNAFTGHVQDFTVNSSTVSSTGRYNFVFRDPGNTQHLLETVNSNNASFEAGELYDEIQAILTGGGFLADLNQTANVNVIYTETLNAGAVCAETFSQTMVINPPVMLDIFGLNDGDILCRNDNTIVSQGNLVTFEGSVTGSGVFRLDDDPDFTAVNPTLNGTVNTASGKATINLLAAYNAASDPSDPRQVYLQYEYTAPGCTGPAEVVKGFEISPPPPLSFDLANSPQPMEVFCNDDAPVQLQTVQNTNVTVTGYGITDSGTGSGVAMFNPQLAFGTSVSNGGSSTQKQNITVTARIVDGIGCANSTNIVYVVNPIPMKDVTFSKTDFCYEDAPALISSPLGKSWYEVQYLGVTTPYTEQIGSISAPEPQFNFNPKQRFDEATQVYGASALTPVNFAVTYFTADADNCVVSEPPRLISVANQIDVTIAGIEADIYCSNENKGKKTLTFNPFPADATKRQFTINGSPVVLNSDKYTFEPGLMGGDFVMRYVVFSGENNCSNTDTLEVKVLPSPEAIFNAPPGCDGELITFTALGSNLPDAVYTWTLSDSVRTGQTLQHRFPASNIYGVQLHVQYPAYNGDPNLACMDSLRLDQTIGAVPANLGFDFFNVCEEDATGFEVQPDVPISQFSWDFGDGISTGLGFSAASITGTASTTGTYQAPSHQYATAGNYNVILTGKTADVFGGCERTEVHNISILKNWAPTPAQPHYEMAQLDGGRGFWVVEDAAGNALWEFNTAAKKHIVTQEPAWITGDTEPYKPEDDSYVNSPCFDLSGFLRPVISLQHWTSTELSDGAVVQYSVDGGKTWARLGNVNSGLGWYDRQLISSNPGDQPDFSSGWSHSDQRAWMVGKHTLDVIPGDRKQVRFRIAFRSFNNSEQLDGFAFNNVVIEERNRTILVENFTHEVFTGNNNAFKAFRSDGDFNFNTAELVKLQYHHASAQGPDPDALHQANPVDQNARAAFYGVANPVRAFVDGGFGQSSTNATFESSALETYFSMRSLVTSPVTINADFVAEPADQLNVKVTVQATSDLGNPGQYNVFIAVAERSVEGQVFVLRKFLPNASGIPLTSLSASDPAQEITVSYDMRHVTRNPDGSFAPFAVIAFVQHLETKDVLQTIMRLDGTASPQIVTGIERTDSHYVRLYPNPADDVVNIVLAAPVSHSTPFRIFDSFGREVHADMFETGQHMKTVPTKELSAGVYLMHLSSPDGLIQKKVMVVHN